MTAALQMMKRRVLEERTTFERASCCVVPTEELAAWVVRSYGVERGKVRVIPNYVDTALFRPLALEPTVDVISIGRLKEHKRHGLLLEALAGTGLSVSIAGQGEQEGRLRRQAERAGVRLELAGRVEHERLPRLINSARLYVILSRWEGHPKALIEAMACGRACVGARSPGIDNLLVDGQTGLVVSPDPAAIRSAVLSLLHDDRRRAELGAAARAHAERELSLDGVVASYLTLLDAVAS